MRVRVFTFLTFCEFILFIYDANICQQTSLQNCYIDYIGINVLIQIKYRSLLLILKLENG